MKICCFFIWKTFCHLDRANSIKNDWQTCNLQTCQSIKQFRLNLPKCQKVFQIQWQNIFTFANEYLLPFRLLSYYKKWLLVYNGKMSNYTSFMHYLPWILRFKRSKLGKYLNKISSLLGALFINHLQMRFWLPSIFQT